MKITLQKFNVSKANFITKLKELLTPGLRTHTGIDNGDEYTAACSDSNGWTFKVTAIINPSSKSILKKLHIDSTHENNKSIQLFVTIDDEDVSLNISKLSDAFAEVEEVDIEEASIFIDAFMQSQFNRYQTQQLFESTTKEGFKEWLIIEK